MKVEIKKRPHLIKFPKIGSSELGYISVAENDTLPFEVKRIYWTYFTPDSVKRGGHAHLALEQILLAVAGTIKVITEMPGEQSQEFILDKANEGLYLPHYCWRTMEYTHNSVQVCIASIQYSESDYIREYAVFKSLTTA